MKWLKKMYPSMTTSSLSHIAHAIVNGTYTTGGSASTAHGDLKAALRKLLCIRKATMGAITRMVRDDRVKDTNRREEHISKHRQTAEQAALTKAQKRAAKVDTARETVMVLNTDALQLQLSTMVKKDGSAHVADTLKHLKEQFRKRIMEERDYTAIGNEHRSEKIGKLVISKDGQNEVGCLSALLRLMIFEDGNHVYRSQGPEAKTLRSLATMCPTRTAVHSADAKVAKALLCAEMAKPVDDPDYVALAVQHKGKLMYDDEADPLQRALLILDITFSVYRSGKYWMVTCIENVIADNGTWIIPKRCYVTEGDAKMIDSEQLRDYTLMDVADVDNPKTYDDVAACVAAHDDREINRLSSLSTGRSGSKRSFNS
jgi:hypothetical protein